MGASGPQRELLAKLSSGTLEVVSYVRTKQGVDGKNRIKQSRETVLRDFHMVGSGYDDKDIWQKLLIPKTSEGKAAVGGGSKMTYRYYLQDACFAAVLEIPADMATEISGAFDGPVFDVYFGRKNCVPTEKIHQGSYASSDDAWEKAGYIMNEKQLLDDFRVLEGEHEGDVMTLNDVPVQFGKIKKYRDRRVTVVSV
jgi:CRISPR system Cascade subunit CasD